MWDRTLSGKGVRSFFIANFYTKRQKKSWSQIFRFYDWLWGKEVLICMSWLVEEGFKFVRPALGQNGAEKQEAGRWEKVRENSFFFFFPPRLFLRPFLNVVFCFPTLSGLKLPREVSQARTWVGGLLYELFNWSSLSVLRTGQQVKQLMLASYFRQWCCRWAFTKVGFLYDFYNQILNKRHFYGNNIKTKVNG